MPCALLIRSIRLKIWSLDGHVESGCRFVGQRIFGSQDKAMAITARCCIPPLNWCGCSK